MGFPLMSGIHSIRKNCNKQNTNIMKYTKQVLTLVLLIGVASSYAQYNNYTYTVNITGVSCITLLGPDYQETNPYDQETTPFNYENNLGKYYPDSDGVIHIELKRGYYEYVTGRNGMNGSFYITTRNVYFEILELDPLCGIDSRKLLYEAHRCLSNKQRKKARELFQIAADAGNVKAMFEYSRMCKNGIGGSKNKNHAYHYMNEALKHGHSMASYMLENFDDKRLWMGYQ